MVNFESTILPYTSTVMVSVAPPRSVDVKVYVPVSCGLRGSVIKSPESVSIILELLGEMVYPLETGGAKFDIFCISTPLIDKEPNINNKLTMF